VSGLPAVACRLDALTTSERARHADLRAALESAILRVEELPDGFALHLPADAAVLVGAAEWIALERVCCPFFRFELILEGSSRRATLRLSGSAEAKELLRAELRADGRIDVGNGAEDGAEIGPLRPEEAGALTALLEENGLPLAGVADHLDAALVVRAGGRVVGSAVLEIYGREALLRSVAVAKALRGRGLGLRLAARALDLAAARGATRVYLLTETAAGFFPRLGFRVIFRSEVPPSVRRSAEFAGACPATAIAMERVLGTGGAA